jgi:hypothetical protein
MSDDLVKRLRDVAEATGPNEARQIALAAADRIEELETKLEAVTTVRELMGHMWGEAEDRIEALEAEIKLHEECATIVHFQGVRYAHENMADAIWAEFKDKWEGERKYALRKIVAFLR